MEAVWSARMALRRALAARLLAEREVAISAALAQTRELQRAAAERRATAGETSRTEFARVSAEAAADSRRLTDAQARLAAADSALAAALGVPGSALQKLDASWADFDAPTAPEAATLAAAKQAAALGAPISFALQAPTTRPNPICARKSPGNFRAFRLVPAIRGSVAW
jgi:outer membrane protein TolC